MKKFQAILDEIMEISRIPMILYNADGSCAAAYTGTDASLDDSVHDFICSDVDSQSLGAFHYFKVISFDTLSYILLVSNFAPDSFTIGRLAVCQLKNLLESQEESVTKSAFIRSLVTGSLSAAEISRQAKKLRLSPTAWTAFVIECQEGFSDSYAYQLLEHAFAGHKLDFCCELDEQHLLLVKDQSNILKEYKAHDASSESIHRTGRKKASAADNGQIAASLKFFAQTLADTLRAEALLQTHIGYSTMADSFSALGRIYQEALTALKIRRTFFAERDTIAYERLGIGRLIAQLSADICHTFLHEVFGAHLPDSLDEETQNTIQKFYENNLNISETARQLYLHRNTLVYRLERLEKTLGLDIRKFDDAMTFHLAMMVLAHVRELES
ncbi:MAG: PucR family transcriptional regulator [Eubacterium sp.]|jgi:Sugar diacid utilization regulator|nr:PucR family transcriptional regulator [Eubacterium sp.]